MERCEICGKKLAICKECDNEFCTFCDGGQEGICTYCLEEHEEMYDDLADFDDLEDIYEDEDYPEVENIVDLDDDIDLDDSFDEDLEDFDDPLLGDIIGDEESSKTIH